MRRSALGWMVALLTAAGCGGSSSSSACDALVKGLNDFVTKGQPCGVTANPTGITADSCKNSINNCTDADKSKLQTFGSCLSNLPTCSTATASAWATQVQTCVSNVSGLSANCGT